MTLDTENEYQKHLLFHKWTHDNHWNYNYEINLYSFNEYQNHNSNYLV